MARRVSWWRQCTSSRIFQGDALTFATAVSSSTRRYTTPHAHSSESSKEKNFFFFCLLVTVSRHGTGLLHGGRVSSSGARPGLPREHVQSSLCWQHCRVLKSRIAPSLSSSFRSHTHTNVYLCMHSVNLWRKKGFSELGRVPNAGRKKDGSYVDAIQVRPKRSGGEGR